jgi:hypothetical protein
MMRPLIRRLAEKLSRTTWVRGPRRSPARAVARPRLEALEDRTLLSFGPSILSATGVFPTGIAVGDFNGDGNLDVVTANTLDNTISVLMGRGDGTFQAPVNYTVGDRPERIAVGALHGSGLPDLVVANAGSNSLTVLLNNGNGTFRNGGMIAIDSGFRAVVLADLNGDGKPDLAVACGAPSDDVDVFLGNGDGTFGPMTRLTNSISWGVSGPIDLVVGDFNRDGKPDIVTANANTSPYPGEDNTVTYFQGNGDGTFLTGANSPSNHRNMGIIAADLRGVGILDLVSAGNTYGLVTTMRGNGNGTFQTPQAYGSSGSNFVGAADFRGTGKPDLVVVDDSGGTLTTLLNAGDGTFPTTQTYPLATGPGAEGHGLAIGDFTGDGKPDVVVALSPLNEVAVLPDEGSDVSQLRVSAAGTTVAGNPLSVTVTAKKSDGTRVTGYTGLVHFAATDAAAALPSDYTFTAADMGVHTFSVTLKTAGPQTVTVSDAFLSLSGSAAVTVSPAAAHHLAFGQQPGNTVAGQAVTPAVTVRVSDQFGNLVSTDGSTVTVAIGANPAGGTLSGTAAEPASGGVATFANLSIDKAGTGYTLQATDGTLGAATSAAFNIVSVSATMSTVSFASPTAAPGNTDLVTLVVKDTAGNAVTGLTGGSFVLTLSGGTSAGTFGPVTETATRGTYTTTFTATSPGTASTLTATVSGVTLTARPTLAVTADNSVVASFAGAGLWRWTLSGGWVQIHPSVPLSFAVDAAGDVVVTFAGAGLWRWTAAAGWAQIHPSVPQGFAVDAAGDVAAIFAGGGLWRWTAAGGWAQIHPSVPLSVAMNAT